MRTVTAAVVTEIGAVVTRPGYLVEIGFAPPARFSSRGTLTWNSNAWTGYDLSLPELTHNSNGSTASGRLVFGNADLTLSAYILADGVSGKAVKVWKFYGEAPALADPVLLFDGVCDAATIDDQGRAEITIQQVSSTVYCPRTYMTSDQGFHYLPASGQVLTWGDDTIRLSQGAY